MGRYNYSLGMKNKLALPKPKKFNRTKAKRKLDKLFSLKIRSLGYCNLNGWDTIHCGGPLQTLHIIGRGNLFLRWDERNAICGCAGHHVYYTYHPEEWRQLMLQFSPDYEKLLQEREKKITFNEVYYKKKLAELGG